MCVYIYIYLFICTHLQSYTQICMVSRIYNCSLQEHLVEGFGCSEGHTGLSNVKKLRLTS